MATPRSQQIGIWVIAIVLMVGTLGSFLAMVLSSQNQAKDQTALQKAYTQYQDDILKQTKRLSDQYYDEFSQYSSLPSEFNSDEVKEVTTKDLKVGDGAELTDKSQYSAYYIGWNPKGVIFDQSIENGTLKAPITGGNLITGWNEGVVGMKFGGIREISIPSSKAYGLTGSGENIPPNTPIKFVVMVIPKIEDVPMPQILKDYYSSQL